MPSTSPRCEHPRHRPTFDSTTAASLTPAEVRRRYPRFDGVCADCGALVIVYACADHYIAGDW